jgi:hypothetical protein
MKLTKTAFKRKRRPATGALEESLHADEHLELMQRKRRRNSLKCNSSTSKNTPYSMSSLWRATEDLEHSLAFPTIEWSFDDDIRGASERGSTSNDDECIQSRHSHNTACLALPALQTSCLLSKNDVEPDRAEAPYCPRGTCGILLLPVLPSHW